jgi:flavin-binding protein dodecin
MADSTVARITEISAQSTEGFEEAIRVGLARAQKTLRNVRSAWIKEQRVSLEVTFILED